MRALSRASYCSQTPQQFQIISSWHEIKSIKGKITTECRADSAAARLRRLSSQQWDWREWEGGGKTLSPGAAGLWAMVPEMWTSTATCKATLCQNQTLPVACEKERCGPSHALDLAKGFSHLGVSLGSKSEAKTESEHETNETPAQGEEEAEGPSLKPVPVCAKGLSLDLGSRGHEVSLPSAMTPDCSPLPPVWLFPSLCLKAVTARAEESHQRSPFQPALCLLPASPKALPERLPWHDCAWLQL